MNLSASFERLVEAFRQAIAEYTSLPPEAFAPEHVPIGSRSRALRYTRPANRPMMMIDDQLPEWRELARSLAIEHGYEAATLRLHSGGPGIVADLLRLVGRSDGRSPEVVAHHFARYLVGPALPPIEYTTVNLAPTEATTTLFDGWELSA